MTELEKRGENVPVAQQMGFGATDDLDSSDCELGRVQVAQALSESVKKRKVQIGDIYNVVNGEVLGNEKEPFEFIVVGTFKYWISKTKRDNKFLGKEPALNPQEKSWEEGDVLNMYHHAFMVLNVKEIPTGFALPYELAFRSTSLSAAKRLSSLLFTMRGQNVPSWGRTFTMISEEKSKDKHSWHIPAISIGRQTSKEEVEMAQLAYSQFNNSKNIILSETKDVYSASEDIENAEY